MQPYVSILVPIYKVPEKFLRQCIESLINQTLRNIEIILVDDGSSDNCGEICNQYAAIDNRIKVIHKKNGGLAAARNSAFYEAKGEYITFVDGDDYLSAETCEITYALAKKKDVQLVFWDQITEYPHSSRIVVTDKNGEREYRGKECKDLQLRVLDFNGKIAQVFSKLINREYLLKYNITHNDNLKQGAEGFIFNITLFEHLESAYYAAVPLYHYIYNEDSISHSHNEENYYLIVRCFEEIERFTQNNDNKEKLQKNLYNRLIYVIVTTGISGYYNPKNKDNYRIKTKQYKKFLQEPILQKAVKQADLQGVSIQRKLILLCIKADIHWPIAILGKIRKKQMINR